MGILPAKRKSRAWKVLSFMLLLVCVLSFLQLRDKDGSINRATVWAFRPVIAPLRAAARGLKSVVVGVFSIRRIYVENAELKITKAKLESQLAALGGVESENQTLRSALKFTEHPPAELLSCNVLGRDPDGLTEALVIGCGTSHGVAIGQGVVSAGYLIGKVILTGPSTSAVRLLSASSTQLDVKIVGRNVSGVLRGTFGTGMWIDFVSESAGITKGDVVATAGINNAIPPDVLVGSVLSVGRERGALFDKISVTSMVDFRDIRYVQVVKK